MRKYLYAVVYVCEYDGLEMYCRVCGIFNSEIEAKAVISAEMKELLKEIGDDFTGDVNTKEYSIRDSRQRHEWFINSVHIDYNFEIKSAEFK